MVTPFARSPAIVRLLVHRGVPTLHREVQIPDLRVGHDRLRTRFPPLPMHAQRVLRWVALKECEGLYLRLGHA